MTVDVALRIVEVVALKPDIGPVQKFAVYKLVFEASVALAAEVVRLKTTVVEADGQHLVTLKQLTNLRSAAERVQREAEWIEGEGETAARVEADVLTALDAALEASK